jgi:hypothetical protein
MKRSATEAAHLFAYRYTSIFQCRATLERRREAESIEGSYAYPLGVPRLGVRHSSLRYHCLASDLRDLRVVSHAFVHMIWK